MAPEPLPLRRASRSPPLASERCRSRPHSVLTRVSPRYPQQGGGLLRPYSPFRHSEAPIIANWGPLVRLACLIHAASVRSEPESNSHSRNCAAAGSPPQPTYSGSSGTSPNPSRPFQIGRSSQKRIPDSMNNRPRPVRPSRPFQKRANESIKNPRCLSTPFLRLPPVRRRATPPGRPRARGPPPQKRT